MSRITVKQFIHGLCLIHSDKPTYKVGHDGSDGSCDGIGLIRGALLRGGATKIKDMKEPNQFARKTAQNIRKNDGDVNLGDVLLKTKSADDSSMPLPLKYRFGGSDFNNDATNYTEVGVIVRLSPLAIMEMTKEGIIKSDKLDEWDYVCSLPYVEEGEKVMSSAIIFTDKTSVKLYAKPSFSCDESIDIPNGSMVRVNDKRSVWSNVSFGENSGFVLTKFLKEAEESKAIEFTDEELKTLEGAYAILGKLLGK